jgi:hypothetical protein
VGVVIADDKFDFTKLPAFFKEKFFYYFAIKQDIIDAFHFFKPIQQRAGYGEIVGEE